MQPEPTPSAAAPAVLHDRDIVCVGFADWDTELWTNQHHLMSRLARDNRVLFIESLGPAPAAAGGARPAADRPAAAPRRSRRRARSTGCTCCRRSCSRCTARRACARSTRACCRCSVRRAARRARPSSGRSCGPTCRRPRRCWTRSTRRWSSTTASTTSPPSRAIDGRRLPGGRGALRGARRPRARRARRRSPSACASSTTTCSYAPNVADTDAVRHALERRPGRRRARRAAAPADRLHGRGRRRRSSTSALLVELARARPSWSFALVGPVGAGDPRTDVSALARRAEHPPARRARLRASCRTCCAAPTRR